MSLLGTLDKLSEHKAQPFLAPIPSTQMVSCFTVQDTIPYWYDLNHPRPGWWWVQPDYLANRPFALLEHEAKPHEYLSYLFQLPRFIVIAVSQTSEGLVVIPYNASDAAQRGWLNSEPRYAYLTRQTIIEPFSVVCVRNMAGTLLYDDLYPLDIQQQSFLLQAANEGVQLQVVPTSFQVAWQIFAPQKFMERLQREQAEAELRRKKLSKTERGRIEDRLGFVGASLVEYRKQGSNFDVTYTYNGATFTVNVRPDLRIESAGICLSGEDSNHDLSSICLVMEQARKLNRPGIDMRWQL